MAQEKATDLKEALGEEGKLAGLTVKVNPELKAYITDLRKCTGKGVSEIVGRALESYFDGYEMSAAPENGDDEE